MRILTYNILEGGLGRIDPIAEVIRFADADVAVLPEATKRGEFYKLADRLGMDAFLALNPRNPEGAVGFLTRWPMVEAVNDAALDPRLTRAALHVTVQQGGTRLTVVGVHLHARETLADEAVRLAELPAVLEIARPLREAGVPHVLAGDFNAHHPAQVIDLNKARRQTLERIAGQNNVIPREVVSRLLEAGYVDAHASQRRPEEFQATLTTAQPVLRTDYLFVPAELGPRVRSCQVLTPPMARFASDHFPVVLELEI